MSESKKYGVDALFYFPLIEDGDADFVTDYTPAAGDAKIFTDKLISTNPTALILGFDSLSEIPAQGAQLDENGAGTAEGVVAFTVIVSGTVGGSDAAGFFFMRSVTGQAWSNDDQININGGTSDIATADSTTYDLAATAGLIAALGNGAFAACLSPTEMTCGQGYIHIVDSATKAIEDQAIHFDTYSSAGLHAFNLDIATQSVSLAAGAITNASLAGNMEIVFETDFATNYNTTRDAWVTNGTDFIGTGWNLGKTGYALTTADWNVGKTGYAVTSTGLDLVLVDGTFLTAVEDQVWDAVLTGNSHNDATSAGRRLRQIDAAFIVTEGTADAGSTSTTINLETGVADATTDDIYAGDRCVIVAGTGVGEHGLILSYSSSDQIATMSKAWVITPDDTSEYILLPADADVELWNDNTVTGDGDWAEMQTDLDAVLLDTADIQPNYATSTALATVDTEIGNMQGNVTDILADTADIQPNYATEAKQDIIDTNVDLLLQGIIFGDAATGTLSTTQATTTLSGFTDDQLIGRVIVFLEGPADGEATDISDYADTNGLITFTALTLAPENGNAFKVI